MLLKPDPAQPALFSAYFWSWSQGRPQFECLEPLKPPPDLWLAQQIQRNRLSLGHHRIVLGASREGDQDGHLISAFCVRLPRERRSSSFQRAINGTKTHLQKHLCEYPRTWEQEVPGAVSKTSPCLTFDFGSGELWNSQQEVQLSQTWHNLYILPSAAPSRHETTFFVAETLSTRNWKSVFHPLKLSRFVLPMWQGQLLE